MIIDWCETHQEETGEIEVTDITDVDRALARVIGDAIQSMVVKDSARRENAEFARFAAKKLSQKLFIGHFEDPLEFLNALVKNSKIDAEQERKSLLPVFYLYRDPGFVFSDGSDYADISNHGTLNADKGAYARVNKSFVKLTYTLTALAWDKPTVSRMGLGVSMWLRHVKSGRKHAFKAKTTLFGVPLELSCEIDLLKDTMGTSSTLPFADNKLNGVSISIEVIAECYEAIGFTAKERRMYLGEGDLLQ